jgi:fructokinase
MDGPEAGDRGDRMRYDVTTLGELVIDLIPDRSATSLAFVAYPGGAPGNVAAGLARLGMKSAMISKVGEDVFGHAAVEALAAAGVATQALIRTRAHNTALAIVSRDATGEISYAFYRENCADANLAEQEIPTDVIAASRILHVGTLLLATPVSAAAQRFAVASAKSSGVRISADVNFRSAFWRDPDTMRRAGLEMVRAASVVKVSRDELELMAGDNEPRSAVRSLWHPDMLLFAVTRGSAGADLYTAEEVVSVHGFPVDAVDMVGCGDAFMASLLADLVTERLTPPRGTALQHVAKRACAAGALVATRSGALLAMPTGAEIDAFMAARREQPR